METTFQIGENQRHSVTLRTGLPDCAISVELDGLRVLNAPLAQDGDTFDCLFMVPPEMGSRVFLQFKYHGQKIENIKAWLDPDSGLLESQGRKHLIGCEFSCERRRNYLLYIPGMHFLRDLGAFVGNGCKFALSHGLLVLALYAIMMSLTVTYIPDAWCIRQLKGKPTDEVEARKIQLVIYCGAAWLLCLSVLVASAVGHGARNPHAPPESNGVVFVLRVTIGLLLGGIACGILFSS